LLLSHPFFEERTCGLAVISRLEAEHWSLLGPNARASGLAAEDERIARPYGAYRSEQIAPAVFSGTVGDVHARARIRVVEIQQSAALIETAFRRIPTGNHRIRVGMEVTPPAGRAVSAVEGPRGTITVITETEGGKSPGHVQFFCPSAMAVQLLPGVLRGIQVEDVFLVIHSLDISFSEVDK
jgi:Ni,Fe-hydrogenase III large subunit